MGERGWLQAGKGHLAASQARSLGNGAAGGREEARPGPGRCVLGCAAWPGWWGVAGAWLGEGVLGNHLMPSLHQQEPLLEAPGRVGSSKGPQGRADRCLAAGRRSRQRDWGALPCPPTSPRPEPCHHPSPFLLLPPGPRRGAVTGGGGTALTTWEPWRLWGWGEGWGRRRQWAPPASPPPNQPREVRRGQDSQQARSHGGPVTLVTFASFLGPQSPRPTQ